MIEQKSSILSNQEEISEKIQIFISARNLKDLGLTTKTDSNLVIKLTQPGQPAKQILKSKVYYNDLNPNYAETVIIDFVFQIRQALTFEIYHKGPRPTLVGKVETTVGEIFGSPTNGLIRPLLNSQNQEAGKIILRCEKVQRTRRKLFSAQISATGLPNFRWWFFFGGTCAFFRIFRRRKNDELLIYQSEVISYSTDPQWKPIKVSQRKLSQMQDTTPIEVRVYNFSSTGDHTVIGTAFCTIKNIQFKKVFDIETSSGQKRGKIVFKDIKRTVKYQFGDYLENGLQLALTTCIDFTASNGAPESITSLHYSKGGRKSSYEEAMSEVLNILLDYDYDKLVPCFGFGAQVRMPTFDTAGKVSHCFPLNGNPDNPDIFHKDEIMKSYRNILGCIRLSGPTYFSELLRKAISLCKQFQANKFKTEYMILFILTDGEIHDKAEVIDLLIECNRLPLSVIIVGVGEGDFKIMHELDDDNCEMVDSKGNRTERDLVQFVEFKKFKNNGVALAREVLEQLPRQVEEYFQMMQIAPEQIKRRPNDVEEQIRLIQEMKINQ